MEEIKFLKFINWIKNNDGKDSRYDMVNEFIDEIVQEFERSVANHNNELQIKVFEALD